MWRLPDRLRPVLGRPLGELVSEIPEWLRTRRPVVLITIGDVVTAHFIREGVPPDIAVVDFKVMRDRSSPEVKAIVQKWQAPEVRVRNPAGTLTNELFEAFTRPERPLKIVVEGEEDLAVIPAVQQTPVGAVIVYGQPREGMVIVRVSEQSKQKFMEFFKQFEKVSE